MDDQLWMTGSRSFFLYNIPYSGLSGQSLHALRTLFALRTGVTLWACRAGQFFQLFLGEHVVGKRRAGGSCFALRAGLTLRAGQRFQLLRREVAIGKCRALFTLWSLRTLWTSWTLRSHNILFFRSFY